jgi:hypothetical protein
MNELQGLSLSFELLQLGRFRKLSGGEVNALFCTPRFGEFGGFVGDVSGHKTEFVHSARIVV